MNKRASSMPLMISTVMRLCISPTGQITYLPGDLSITKRLIGLGLGGCKARAMLKAVGTADPHTYVSCFRNQYFSGTFLFLPMTQSKCPVKVVFLLA